MQKKILLIGATGTLGNAIAAELARDCDVIKVGGSSGEHTVDIACSDSIAKIYQKFPEVNAVVCAAARGVIFKPIQQMTKEDYLKSLQSKQLGQIDLVTQGLKMLGDDVSFTLTTGLLNFDPIAAATAAAMVNSAIEGFVRAAAVDMPAQQRINVISPALVQESLDKYRDVFPGYNPVPAATVALAYRKAIMGRQTGQVIRVGW